MLIFILLYLGIQFVIGYVISKKIKSEQDFLLAGRKIPTWMLTFSLFATWFGAETCIGTSGAVYEQGLSGSRADPFGYTLCLILVGLFLAKKLWNGGYVTLADFFGQRYGRLAEKIAVWLLLPSSLFWGAAQIRAFGQVIASTTNIPVEFTMTFAFIIVVVYTLLGGLMGDIITDLIQGIIIAVGLIIILAVVLSYGEISFTPEFFSSERLSFIASNESWAERLDRWLIPILGSLVAQELISRILAAKNASAAKAASFYSAAIYIVLGLIPVFLGLIGPQVLPGITDREQFLVLLAQKYLPTTLVFIFVGSLVSAILATIDSILLASSALISHNLIIPWLKIADEKKKLRCVRITIVIIGVLSYVIAIYSEGIYELVEMASSFGSAGVLVVTLIGLWSNFGGKVAAVMALLTGLVSFPLAEYLLKWPAPFATSIAAAFIAYCLGALIFDGKILKPQGHHLASLPEHQA